MSEYFVSSEVCPKSKELVLHTSITTMRSGPCGLLNPNFIKSEPISLDRGRSIPSSGQEIIEIEESPTGNKFSSPLIVPTKRRGTATQIPSIPNLKLGYAEPERQVVDQRIVDRKSKTGFSSYIPTVHFNVGVAHYTYNHSMDDGSYWTASSSYFSIDEENRHLTSNAFTESLLIKARNQAKRPNVKKWVVCGEESDWSLAHTNPVKVPARDIAPWPQTKLLSKAIDAGSYEQKPISGSMQKLVLIWLYYTPPVPTSSKLSPPLPHKPMLKPIKKEKVKIEKKIKKEKDIKFESTRGRKRLRAHSTKPPSVTRTNTIIRRQAKLMEELDDYLTEEDDEFPSLEDVIEYAESREGEDIIGI